MNTYDELDALKTATRGGVTTTINYDNAGRKLNMNDPDMGTWQYTYDALGNLKTQTDARGCVLTMGYDNLSRLTTKVSNGGGCGTQVNESYSYDAGTTGKGHRTGMTDGSGSSTWGYDERGRMISASKTITGGETFQTGWAYNSADLLTTLTYPDGEEVNYTYDARMLLDTLSGTSNYVTDTQYDPAGRATSRSLGNGLAQSMSYYGWSEQVGGIWQGGRLHTLETGTLQDLAYTYDKVGNITQIVDAHASETSTYGYDGLNRLTGWTLNGTPETYAYDATTGNLAAKAGVNYTYNSGHAHGVSSLSDGSSYQYDANGSMTQRVVGGQTFNLGYDAENRLVSVSGAVTASFGYDGDSRRVKSTIGNTTTYFVGNIYESTGGVATKYYYAGAARIAMRVGTADPYYLLTDHIGSTTVTTDASGSLVSELKYGPWGEVRSGTAPTNYTFTGQYSNTSDFGLMFYNARWYDPSLSRFVSPDSIIPNPADPQAWNRYTYVQNRPTVLADPTGHRVACGEQGAACDDGALPVDYSRKLTKSHQIERIFPGITINNPYAFSLAQLNTLTQALGAVFAAFGNNRAAFRNAFGPMSFTLVRQGSLGENVAARADMWDTARIRLTSRASYGNLIHEMGHIFDGRFYRNGKTKTLFSEYFADHLNSGTCSRSPCGSGDGFEAGTWKPSGIHTDYAEDSSLEDFADSFQAAITGDYRNVDQERIAFIRIAIALMVAPYSN